jgi:methionine-rich copper-binding protein CopC
MGYGSRNQNASFEATVVIYAARLASAFVVLALLWCGVAEANTNERASINPQPAEIAASLSLVFSENVDLTKTFVELRDAEGHQFAIGPLQFGSNGSEVQVPLVAPLPPGTFTINWRTFSESGRMDIGGYAFVIDRQMTGTPGLTQVGLTSDLIDLRPTR